MKAVATTRDDSRVSHDADVLARLDVWNRRLLADGSPYRVLYLTADLSLFRAAATVDASWEGEGRSFAHAFLRHPRAYLAEEGVLGKVDDAVVRGENDEVETVGDWLSLLTHPADSSFAELLDALREGRGPPLAIANISP